MRVHSWLFLLLLAINMEIIGQRRKQLVIYQT